MEDVTVAFLCISFSVSDNKSSLECLLKGLSLSLCLDTFIHVSLVHNNCSPSDSVVSASMTEETWERKCLTRGRTVTFLPLKLDLCSLILSLFPFPSLPMISFGFFAKEEKARNECHDLCRCLFCRSRFSKSLVSLFCMTVFPFLDRCCPCEFYCLFSSFLSFHRTQFSVSIMNSSDVFFLNPNLHVEKRAGNEDRRWGWSRKETQEREKRKRRGERREETGCQCLMASLSWLDLASLAWDRFPFFSCQLLTFPLLLLLHPDVFRLPSKSNWSSSQLLFPHFTISLQNRVSLFPEISFSFSSMFLF